MGVKPLEGRRYGSAGSLWYTGKDPKRTTAAQPYTPSVGTNVSTEVPRSEDANRMTTAQPYTGSQPGFSRYKHTYRRKCFELRVNQLFLQQTEARMRR